MGAKKNKAIPAEHAIAASAKTVADGKTIAGKSKWAPIAAGAAILAFTALLYVKAIGNGFTFMDDDFYILNNPFIRNFSWKGVVAIFTSFNNYNYHPITTLTDMFIYRWFGLDPLPYHLLNVLLHLLNVWLVYVFTEKISGRKMTGLVVALLFAVHPLHVESVAWVSERKDVSYTAFYLAALIIYLRYLYSGQQAKYYALALLLFLASLFSKSAAVTLPVLLVAIDAYKGRKRDARALLEKIPFLLLSIVFGILAIKSQGSGGAINDISLYFNFVNRFFLFTSGIAFYVIKLVFPFDLNALHFFPYLAGNILPWYYYLSLPFLVMLAWLIARKNTYRMDIVFGSSFFLITISVMLQIVPVGASLVAERYTYVPYIGLFYIAGQWIADNYLQRKKIIVPVFSAVIVVFTIQSWLRIDVWKDTNTLFTDIVEKNPGNWRDGMVYNSWGDFEKYYGDNKAALQKYSEAVRLFPRYPLAYYNRGNIYEETGDIRSALSDFDNAVKLNPGHANYYNSRGWAYYQLGNKQAAVVDYNEALSIDPNFPEAYNNRGWAYYESGDLKSSANDFSKAIMVAPGYAKPYYNRAMIRVKSGDMAGAVEDYNSLIMLNGDDALAYYNRGIIRMNQKNMQGACADWKKSVELGNKEAEDMLRGYCR